MANYYTKFSFTVPIAVSKNQAEDEGLAGRLAADLRRLISEALEDPEHEVFPEEDALMYGLHVAASGSEVWITDDAGEGSVDGAIAATQWLLRQEGAPDEIHFEWSNDCDKARTDAYGGGVAEVTAGSVKTWGSWQGVPPSPPEEQWVVVTGSPMDAVLHGPFRSNGEAIDWAEAECIESWWVEEVQPAKEARHG